MTPFDLPEALALTRARIVHLESLELDWAGKSVLEVGCGAGYLSEWLLAQGARVTAIDTRDENLIATREKSRSLIVYKEDIQGLHSWLGVYDIVFCYGVLYHLENPIQALRNMVKMCHELLLIETIVCDHPAPIAILRDENPAFVDQGMTELSLVPSGQFINQALRALGLEYRYTTAKWPDHPHFTWKPQADLAHEHDGRPMRLILAASRKPLDPAKFLRLS